MANRRKQSRSSRRAGGRPSWLPLIALGAVLLIGAVAVIVFGQRDKSKTQSGTTSFDPNFTPEVSGAPRVEVDQDSIDYGDVKLGTTINTVFNVRNVGDQPLTILGEPRVELVEGC